MLITFLSPSWYAFPRVMVFWGRRITTPLPNMTATDPHNAANTTWPNYTAWTSKYLFPSRLPPSHWFTGMTGPCLVTQHPPYYKSASTGWFMWPVSLVFNFYIHMLGMRKFYFNANRKLHAEGLVNFRCGEARDNNGLWSLSVVLWCFDLLVIKKPIKYIKRQLNDNLQ